MITTKRLKELLKYNKLTGVFTWLVHRQCVRAGSIAGTQHPSGYVYIKIDGKSYAAHRLAWLYVKGVLPPVQVDHRNLKRANNRWKNLRKATNGQNKHNGKKYSNNTSGYKGVSWRKDRGLFQAYISINNKRIYLGFFNTALAGYRARCKATIVHHKQFGRK